MVFPVTRLRRLRRGEGLRAMVRETRLSPEQLVYPMFVCSGEGIRREIPSMPGIYHLSMDALVEEARSVKALGVGAILLYGIPKSKDDHGSSAYDDHGIVQEAVRALKREAKDIVVITDVCLCKYTTHGHCGLVHADEVRNDATVELLAKTALSHVKAGADVVAPSDMMDGRVGAIRAMLERSGHKNTPIMSCAVKYASAFYEPFHEAMDYALTSGDRRSYEMDPANAREALREVELDIEEGADILLVKPAVPSLDIIRMIRERYAHPLAAYQVSGEYSALVAAGRLHWLELPQAMMESLISIRRAGADILVTYFAKEAAKLL